MSTNIETNTDTLSVRAAPKHNWIFICIFYAWQEIKIRYKGSYLGPFWLVATTVVQMVTLGIIYPKLFGIDGKEYIKWLACSLTTWQFIASGVMDSCAVFTAPKDLYLNQKIPFWFFSLKSVLTGLLIFFHQLPVYLFVAFIFKIHFSLFSLLSLVLGILVVSAFLFFCSIILGIICARFKDMPQIVANLMNIAFLVTPVIWDPRLLPRAEIVIRFNPFYYLMESIRAPLLGSYMVLDKWYILGSLVLIAGGIAYWMYARFQSRIAFW